MASASKLSVSQLQQAIKNGTVPAYIGIPLMQEKMKQAKQAQTPPAPQSPPIAQQVMAEAAGIDQVPSNLPTQSMNDGGIVSFADGGDVEEFDQEAYEDQQDEAEYAQAIEESLNAAEQGGGSKKSVDVNRTPNVEKGIKAPAGDFYKNIYGVLKTKAEEMGFKNPEAIARVGAAQSALETGYGKALAGGNNYFGIKGSGGNKQSTKEYSPERGYYTSNESFRTYNGMEDSAADYLRLMQNPRYAKVAAAQTPEEAIAHQSRSGYATSPQYGSSLRAIHQSNMAEGGIARLNKGGVAHFYGGGANDTRSEEDKRLDEILNNIQDPATLYPEKAPVGRGAESSNPFVSGRYLNPNNLPRATDAQRTQYLQHALSFGEDGFAGALNERSDRLLPPGVTLPNVPAATSIPAASQSPPMQAPFDYEYGKGASLPIKRKTDTGTDTLKDTGSEGDSSGGANSGAGSSSRGGERQKSEYDLIREDIMSQREELKRQKQEDKYMAIIQAGLGMMAGTSPNAMANIGQGASAGIAQYGASGKQRAAENAALNKGLITAQRYKGMDDYQRAALASRESYQDRMLGDKGEANAERKELKQAELDARIDKNLADAITNNAAKIDLALQKKYGEVSLMGTKERAAFEAERADRYNKEVNHYIQIQNQRLQQRYPDIFKDTNSVRPAPTGGNRIRVDAKGNVIN
jgi:flagellum-specific peptidoglycan hydrolase FlgJ